jgi:hypothetical protein
MTSGQRSSSDSHGFQDLLYGLHIYVLDLSSKSKAFLWLHVDGGHILFFIFYVLSMWE